jgi:hypothetical protein
VTIPWRDWLGAAVVRLGWRPAEFWSATMTEFFASLDFWAEANGLTKRSNAPTRERLDELKRKYG